VLDEIYTYTTVIYNIYVTRSYQLTKLNIIIFIVSNEMSYGTQFVCPTSENLPMTIDYIPTKLLYNWLQYT